MITCVSIHAPARRATPDRGSLIRSVLVSIHAPARRATRHSIQDCRRSRCFNPRPRAGGDAQASAADSQVTCFNPRPRAGGDVQCPTMLHVHNVSIHAPARGATHRALDERSDRRVSIHAPARGATMRLHGIAAIIECFNPRPRARGDAGNLPANRSRECVSIHAPARGATDARAIDLIAIDVSIHAPARGATTMRSAQRSQSAQFQSTPPRGGRQHRVPIVIRQMFQSTPPRGGRRAAIADAGRSNAVSIHAPARGATVSVTSLRHAVSSFNPRPRAGATTSSAMLVDGARMFQSTPPRGGRPTASLALSKSGIGFNPRPRAGGDARIKSRAASISDVSIHAPARGATCDAAWLMSVDWFQSTPPRGGRLRSTASCAA